MCKEDYKQIYKMRTPCILAIIVFYAMKVNASMRISKCKNSCLDRRACFKKCLYSRHCKQEQFISLNVCKYCILICQRCCQKKTHSQRVDVDAKSIAMRFNNRTRTPRKVMNVKLLYHFYFRGWSYFLCCLLSVLEKYNQKVFYSCNI